MKASEKRMTFWEHVGELRARLLRTIVFYFIAFAFTFYFKDKLFDLLRYPLPEGTKLYYFAVTEAFFFYVKIAMVSALVITLPYLLIELYAFFAPALTRNEKKLIFPAIPFVILLFIVGCVFTFLVIMPLSIRFLLSFGENGIEAILQADKYFGFVIGLTVGGGIAFELPIVLAILAKVGWVTSRGLIRNFRYAFLIILILTAVLTPTPDVFTMLVLALPLVLLYLLSIAVVSRISPACTYEDEVKSYR